MLKQGLEDEIAVAKKQLSESTQTRAVTEEELHAAEQSAAVHERLGRVELNDGARRRGERGSPSTHETLRPEQRSEQWPKQRPEQAFATVERARQIVPPGAHSARHVAGAGGVLVARRVVPTAGERPPTRTARRPHGLAAAHVDSTASPTLTYAVCGRRASSSCRSATRPGDPDARGGAVFAAPKLGSLAPAVGSTR